MRLLPLALYALATISSQVHALSYFDDEDLPDRNVFDNPDQQIIKEHPLTGPLTIVVKTETSLSRTADIATLNLQLSATARGQENAKAELNILQKEVEAHLVALLSFSSSETATSPPIIEGWEFTRLILMDVCCEKGIKVPNGWGEQRWIGEEQAAKVDLAVRFNDLSGLEELRKRVGGNASQVVFSSVEWGFKESSFAELKMEVRREAVEDARVAAQDYADVFGFGEVRAVELEEVRVWIDKGFPGWKVRHFDWMNDEGRVFEPEEVVVKTSLRGKFRAG